MECHELSRERAVAACAPGYQNEPHNLTHASAMPGKPLIHILGRQELWKRWGIGRLNTASGLKTDTSVAGLELAAQGCGVILTLESFVRPYLESERLVIPFDEAVDTDMGHYLLEPLDRKEHAGIDSFRDWMLEQVDHG